MGKPGQRPKNQNHYLAACRKVATANLLERERHLAANLGRDDVTQWIVAAQLKIVRGELRRRRGHAGDDARWAAYWRDQGMEPDWMRCEQCSAVVDQEIQCPNGHPQPLGPEWEDAA